MLFQSQIDVQENVNLILKLFERMKRLTGDQLLDVVDLLTELATTYPEGSEQKGLLLGTATTLGCFKAKKRGAMSKVIDKMVDDMDGLERIPEKDIPNFLFNKGGWKFNASKDAHWKEIGGEKYWCKYLHYVNLPTEYYRKEVAIGV